MAYVDGFVVPVPRKNVAAYRRLARKAGVVWKEYGAVAYMECLGDDLNPKMPVNFPKTLKLKTGETVFFSWIVYKNKAQRDRVNKLIMKDPRIAKMMSGKPPFDYTRMLYGGFKPIVAL
jgi:uncharacterized protein YbaA (DUF1428 family)